MGFGRHSTGDTPAERSLVHEARVAVMTLDRALRGGGLAGPADAYYLMGSLALSTSALQRSMTELAAWLREEERRRHLTVADGPFVDEPDAAVRVAAHSLMQASQACQEVFDALERAHIALAHVGAETDTANGPARRSLRRRRSS